MDPGGGGMSITSAFPALGGRGGRLREKVRTLGTGLSAAVKTRAAPGVKHHGYTIAGFGCISGAAFVHSVFTGLLVTGILFLVFEWKVSE